MTKEHPNHRAKRRKDKEAKKAAKQQQEESDRVNREYAPGVDPLFEPRY